MTFHSKVFHSLGGRGNFFLTPPQPTLSHVTSRHVILTHPTSRYVTYPLIHPPHPLRRNRGLDVPDLVCVINYSCPNHLEDYVHRVGRTGRAGRKGTAYTFISAEEEQHAPTLIKALTQSKQKVRPPTKPNQTTSEIVFFLLQIIL